MSLLNNLPGGYFIAGTDTGVGKTLIACALIHALASQGKRVAGMKPLASGATWQDGAWRNDDVEALRAVANVRLTPALMNPYLLRAATAPHIAAAREGIQIDLQHIVNCFAAIGHTQPPPDTIIVEGAGGFLVPLNDLHDGGDLACRLGLPVILVVGIRLGCINHALLTCQAISARQLVLAGWVANIISPELLHVQATIASLQSRIKAPLLGCIPQLPQTDPAMLVKSAAALLTLP